MKGLIAGLLVIGLGLTLTAALATQRFMHVPVPDVPSSRAVACAPVQEARGSARWAENHQGGTLYGLGSFVFQRCQDGVWTFHVKGIPFQEIPPRLLVSLAGQQLFDGALSQPRTIRVPAPAGQPVIFTAPNTQIVLEDRNLYVQRFRFQPAFPCLQNPPQLSGPNVGTAAHSDFSLLSNGALVFTACGEGNVSFRLVGSETAGIGPAVQVQVGATTLVSTTIPKLHPRDIRLHLARGQTLRIIFSNDSARQVGARLIVLENATFSSAK